MGANESEERHYLPDGGQDLAALRRLLGGQEESDAPHLVLTREGTDDRVELPSALRQMLDQAVGVLSDGQAVVVLPRPTMLTTQQAADILEVSRSTVTRLIADGELPTERPGARRGLRLADVLDFRERRRLDQHEMLVETFSGLSAGTADDEVAPTKAPDRKAAPERGLPSRKKKRRGSGTRKTP